MSIAIAQQRATMPTGTNQVLDRRSLERGHEKLVPFLQPGRTVLDVGCGSGTITKGIAERVGPTGRVVGIDTSEELIIRARQHAEMPANFAFECTDLFDFSPSIKFDIVTAARTLQWLANPREALAKMKSLLKAGGLVHILDYNHEKIAWSPAPPASMKTFYEKFLTWRRDAGMHNQIADELDGWMTDLGLKNVTIQPAHELVSSHEPDFREAAGIWTKVAELRGPQMVREGYLTEHERWAAIHDYTEWLGSAQSVKMYLLAVSGYLKS